MAPSCSLRDTGDDREPQVTGSEAATRGPCGDVPELPSPRPIRSVRPSGPPLPPGLSRSPAGTPERPGPRWWQQVSASAGQDAPGHGSREWLWDPCFRSHGTGHTGWSWEARPTLLRPGRGTQGGRLPTRASPQKLSSRIGGDVGGARLWTTGVRVPLALGGKNDLLCDWGAR